MCGSSLQETRRNTLIKDGMREQCIPHLVESWFQILQTYQQSHPELTCQCLEVVGAYVSWIDLNLIANDRSAGMIRIRNLTCFCSHSNKDGRCDSASSCVLPPIRSRLSIVMSSHYKLKLT